MIINKNKTIKFVFGLLGNLTSFQKECIYLNLGGNALFNSIDWVYHNISALSKDRDNPNEYLIESDSGFSYIGFYAACYPTSTQNNRGRICLSDFTVIF